MTKTDDIKSVLSFAFAVGKLVEGLFDGLGFDDIAKAVNAARLAGPAIAGASAALEEYRAMTDADAAELEAWVVANFDLTDDKVEAAIESALKLVIELHGLLALLLKKAA